jgi:hypothetical protein
MTTLSEYKDINTPKDCPFCGCQEEIDGNSVGCPDVDCIAFLMIDRSIDVQDNIREWRTRSDKLTPSLIRVIELAESALQDAVSLLQEHGYSLNEHKNALSEIRKLRGE